MKRIIGLILCMLIFQSVAIAFSGKTYHRIALDRLNSKLEYLEKNLKSSGENYEKKN